MKGPVLERGQELVQLLQVPLFDGAAGTSEIPHGASGHIGGLVPSRETGNRWPPLEIPVMAGFPDVVAVPNESALYALEQISIRLGRKLVQQLARATL